MVKIIRPYFTVLTEQGEETGIASYDAEKILREIEKAGIDNHIVKVSMENHEDYTVRSNRERLRQYIEWESQELKRVYGYASPRAQRREKAEMEKLDRQKAMLR